MKENTKEAREKPEEIWDGLMSGEILLAAVAAPIGAALFYFMLVVLRLAMECL